MKIDLNVEELFFVAGGVIDDVGEWKGFCARMRRTCSGYGKNKVRPVISWKRCKAWCINGAVNRPSKNLRVCCFYNIGMNLIIVEEI